MTLAANLVLTFFTASVLSTTWISMAVLVRMGKTVFFPLSLSYLGGALVLLVLMVFMTRQLPRISLRLLHASITVAALSYVFSPLMCMIALKCFPSAYAAFVYTSMPLWFVLFAYGEGREKLFIHILTVLGLASFFYGVYPESALRGQVGLSLLFLVVGMLSFMLGTWVSRRLFWLHSALELNFWSMLFASVTLFLFSLGFEQVGAAWKYEGIYWKWLLFFSLVVTGLGSFFYRVRQGMANSLFMTVLVPMGALVWGVLLWQESPLNRFTAVGALMVLTPLVYFSLRVDPKKWLCLYLNNDRRQGDRLACMLQGMIRSLDGENHLLQVIEVSISGLGFRTEVSFQVGQNVSVLIPIGRMENQIVLNCCVAHIRGNPDSKAFPYIGGLQFQSLSNEKWQILTEFVAQLSNAES